MLLDELKAKIVAGGHASTSTGTGWGIVLGDLPDSALDSTNVPDRIVAIRETQGGPPSQRPRFQDAGFQVIVRGEAISATSGAYEDARLLAEQIDFDLGAVGAEQLSGVHYIGIWPQQTPFFGGYDERHRPRFVCNYRALRSATS